MKTFHPRQAPSNVRVFTSLLISFVILLTPVMPVSATALRAGVRPSGSAGLMPGAFDPPSAIVSATKTDSFPDPETDGKAEPGQTITYDVNVSNSGATDATGVAFNDTIDPNTTLVPGSLRVSPLAFADSYNATKDIALSIPAPGVLSNDTGTPAPAAQTIASGPTAQGGTVTLNADGSFNYTPPAGFEGADTFSYTAANGTTPNDTATVTINVDAGPTVTTTSPVNGASSVAQNSNITINFSEPVNATTGSFSVQCPTGSPQTFTLSASPSASFTLDPTADLPAGTTCTVTVIASQITDADNFDPPDQMAADYTFSFGVKPLAVDDMRSATGNVRIDTAVTGYSVLANDQAPGATITSFDATSANGGEVVMNTTTGTFSYNPPRGFTGTDSFNYTISSGAGSDTGTVVLTVTDMLWFINNAPGACSSNCDGRLTNPYTTLAAFDAADGTVGAGNPEAGDDIFLYTGVGAYSGPLTLENDQKLVGQGAPASISAITLITPAPDSDPLPSTGGAPPVITTTGVAVAGITLAQNDQIHGVNLTNTTGTAIRNTPTAPVGAFLMNTVTVSNTTTTGAGVTLNASGTAEATGVNNITVGAASALNVTNTNIGAAGMTFRSISSNGGTPNGITLNNTGSAGGLTVTGNGAAGTGGTIQNKTGTLATQGNGVSLTNTASVSLAWMSIQGNQNYGIRGTNVSGFALDNSAVGTVTKNGNSATADPNPVTGVAGETSLRFTNLTGTAAISNSTLDNGFTRTVVVENDVATPLNLSVTNSTINESLNSSNGGDVGGNTTDAMLIDARSIATANVTVTGSHFTAYRQFAIQSIARDTATMEYNISGSDFSNSNTGNVGASGSLSLGGSGTDTFVKFNIHDNTFRHGTGATAPNNGGAHLVAGLVSGAGKFEGKFVNNTVGVSGVPFSGAGNAADALRLFSSGNAGTSRVTGTTHTRYLVQGNTIQRYGEVGVQVNARQGNSVIDATFFGNVIREPGSPAGGAFAGIWANSGALGSDTNVLNLAVGDANVAANKNTLQDSDPNNYDDLFIDSGSCGGCASSINVYQNGSDASGATIEDKIRDVLVDDNFPALDLGAGFTGGNLAVVPGLPQQVALLEPQFNAPANGALYNASVASNETTPRSTATGEKKAVGLTSAPGARAEIASNSTRSLAGGSLDMPTSKRKGGLSLRNSAADSSAPLVTAPHAAARATSLFSGETVNANIGTLPAGKSVHITFQVTVDNPFPTGVSQVANQGTISGDNFGTVATDDPAAGGSSDPTVTPILTAPDVAIKDASVAEPATGSAPAAFAVTLSHGYTHTVTVNYATAPDTGGANPATAGSDYTPTSGTLTFNPGETVQTVSVPVLADGDASETNETFLVNISGATGGANVADSQAVGTITPNSTPGTVIISELRTSGPAGPDDEFVELLNNTDSPITVASSDASGGWAIVKSGNDCSSTPVVVAVIPAGAVIPARGNYLVVGSAYSLGAYAAGDQSLVFGIEDDRNVALFNTADLSNVSTVTRLDAVGFGANAGGNCDLLREGSTLADAAGSTSEYSFVRKVDKGSTQDTNVNSDDFIVVSTTAGAVGSNAAPTLGAPGPENSTGARGPVPCNVPDTARFGRSRLDSTVGLGSSPNTVRDATVGPNAANGTIDFRRRFTNNTGGAVTQLRFRITNTTSPSSPGAADLRALSSSAVVVSGVNDPATCGGPTPCSVNVVGATLEQPPTQTSGGGINSTLGVGTITTLTPLAPGASVNLHLLFGVQQTGAYHLSIVIETATAGSIGQDEWELRGNTEDGSQASEGGCNTPPVANAGADQTIECGGATTAVTLDGSASTDADGDTLTYEWREGATVLGTTAVLNTSLAFGPHTITLKVTDPSGEFSEDTVSVNVVDTADPMISAPPNVTVNTGPGATSCGAVISDATLGSATASDGCSASVTVTRTGVPSGNNFPVGQTIVTYTADDGHGHTKSAQQAVTVIDNTPPTLSVPANVVVNAPANSCSANVDPGTATAGDNCSGVTVAGTRSDSQPLNAPYPVGTTTITWKATDASNNTTTGTQTVTVKDATPPVIVLTSGTITLGPPNHSYQTLTLANLVASASDGCDPSVDINDVVISQATSDEADDAPGGGDGNTSNDIVIAPDCKSLQLRAERQGSGDGRVYKVTLKVKDSSGNVATAVRTVVVPQTGPVVDSGVNYTVNGCTP